jgi:hypothetical protein
MYAGTCIYRDTNMQDIERLNINNLYKHIKTQKLYKYNKV